MYPNSKITGLDTTTRYIRIGQEIIKGNTVKILLQNFGDVQQFYQFSINDNDIFKCKVNNNIQFLQSDLCNIDYNKFNDYNIIIISNLTDLYAPKVLLQNLYKLTSKKSLIFIFCTCSWNTHSTPDKDMWVGNIRERNTNEIVYYSDFLYNILSPYFTLLPQFTTDINFTKRMDARNAQVCVANLTVWCTKE